MTLYELLNGLEDEELQAKAKMLIDNGCPGEYEGFSGIIQLGIDLGLVIRAEKE